MLSGLEVEALYFLKSFFFHTFSKEQYMPEVSVRTLGPYIIVGKRQTHLKKEMTYLRYVTTKYNFVNYWNWTFCVKNMFSKFTRIFF